MWVIHGIIRLYISLTKKGIPIAIGQDFKKEVGLEILLSIRPSP